MQSVIKNAAKLRAARRWDFDYHRPEYAQVIDSLGRVHPVVGLGDIITLLTDMGAFSLYKTEFFTDVGIPFLRVQNIQEYGVDLAKDTKYISREYHEQLKKSQLQPDDLLITTKAIIGVATVVEPNFGDCNMSQNLVRIRLADGINPHYVAVFLNSRLGRTQTVTAATGPNQKYLNFRRIREVRIPLPPRDVQDRIAGVMQAAYASRRAKLAEAERLVNTMDEWALEQLGITFSGKGEERSFAILGSDLTRQRWDVGYHQPHNHIFDDASTWIMLGGLVEVKKDTVTPSKNPQAEYYYVAIEGMDNNPYSTDENAVRLKGEEINGLRQWFLGNDVLFARLAPCIVNKKSAQVPQAIEKGCGSTEFIVIRPKKGVDSRFVLWAIKADFMLEQMQSKVRGTVPSRMRLYAEDLLRMYIPIASLRQQVTIGDELEKRRAEAKRLRAEAEQVVAEAKAKVERMILGEEDAA